MINLNITLLAVIQKKKEEAELYKIVNVRWRFNYKAQFPKQISTTFNFLSHEYFCIEIYPTYITQYEL